MSNPTCNMWNIIALAVSAAHPQIASQDRVVCGFCNRLPSFDLKTWISSNDESLRVPRPNTDQKKVDAHRRAKPYASAAIVTL